MRPSAALLLWATVLLGAASGGVAARSPLSRRASLSSLAASRPRAAADPRAASLLAQCTERWRDARLDHFTWSSPAASSTFKQRFFTCDAHYSAAAAAAGSGRKGGAIFFYLGNEADVTLYLNNTGLMWELAPRHGALLVFAEHRYYGASKPFPGKELKGKMGWLTSEQAMADYAELIWELRQELGDPDLPVIGFGGSYGGMLATWFRIKYPHLLDGAVAASAPIWTFAGEDPPYDAGGFAAGVTWDASAAGGSAKACVPNTRAAWATMFDWGASAEGRAGVAAAMRLCGRSDKVLPDADAVEALADWAAEAWSYLAMGDYPYPSDYITNGEAELPAYPVRAACGHLADGELQGEALLAGMAAAVGVFYNASGSAACFDFSASAGEATQEDATFWDYQFCTEQWMPQGSDGVRDMFWARPFDPAAERRRCADAWGVAPSELKPSVEWGGRRIAAATNIVFSNGGRDPWRYGGVTASLSETLVALDIPEGAHHLDLMFSHEGDPGSVKEARAVHDELIERWIWEARERRGPEAAAAGGGGPLRRGAGGGAAPVSTS